MAKSASVHSVAGYQEAGMGNFARVPNNLARFICDTFGYRVKCIELPLDKGQPKEVLLEPLQEGVIKYPPVAVIKAPKL
jgi:hypothetical protein